MAMKHFYETIPGNMDFEELYRNAVRMAPAEGALFVEVGAWKGRSAAYMAVEILNSGKKIDFDVVDLWERATFLRDLESHPYEPARWDEFMANIKPAREGIRWIIGEDSASSAAFVAESSVDFVFIDADHRYEGVLRDIKAWWPTIKPGGVLAGHDHTVEFPGVEKAVREVFGDRYEIHGSSWLVRR